MIKKSVIGISIAYLALIGAAPQANHITKQWDIFLKDLASNQTQLSDLQKQYESARQDLYQKLRDAYHLDLNKLGRVTPDQAPHQLSKHELYYHQEAQKLIDTFQDMQHILFLNLTRPQRKLPLTVQPEQLKSIMRDYMVPRVTQTYTKIVNLAEKKSDHSDHNVWSAVKNAVHNATMKPNDLEYLDPVVKAYLAAKDHVLTSLKHKHAIDIAALLKPFDDADEKTQKAALTKLTPKKQVQARAARQLRLYFRSIEQTIGLGWSSDARLIQQDKKLITTKYIPAIEQAYHDILHPKVPTKKK